MRMNLPNPRFFFPSIHSQLLSDMFGLFYDLLIILPFLLSVQSCQSCIDCFTLSASEQIYLDGDLMRSRHLFLWPWELSIWAHPPLDFQHECWIILLVFEREVPIQFSGEFGQAMQAYLPYPPTSSSLTLILFTTWFSKVVFKVVTSSDVDTFGRWPNRLEVQIDIFL